MEFIEENKRKIICIGWHKTGTTTIGDALLKLGFSVVGARLDLVDDLIKEDYESCFDLINRYDAVQDVPWCALFKEIDEKFENTKFILTIRDSKDWLNSAKKHFKDDYFKMHEYLYGEGVLEGNEERYLKRYLAHNDEVIKYFSDRPDDLLVLNFSKGHGWSELCAFLNIKIPRSSFPHSNKGAHTLEPKEKLILFLKGLIPMELRKVRMNFLKSIGKDPRYRFNNREENQKILDASKNK